MFNPFASTKSTEPLDIEIETLHAYITEIGPKNEEYTAQLANLKTLMDIKEKNSKKPIGNEAWLAAGTSVFTVLAVLWYEHAHVITSKAASAAMRAIR